ncbi:MAG: prepilin-type N-terminal cleavage/methylation domain-containing protein [Tepidisphaeraceae bacterium]|jgi:prepilin-type processing-associated H-X9-DG protein/prepilin-type N-terminal cleavage/methylation domain-containing protein
MRRAFTLVEVLVVIGIITVLMGILMPVLTKVRRQAARTQCATNLRTLASGYFIYANDNHGLSCPARLPVDWATKGVYSLGDGDQYRPRWYELLGVTMKKYPTKKFNVIQDDSWLVENPLFLCPTVPDWNNSRNYPYGYNYQFLGNTRRKPNGEFIHFPVKTSLIHAGSTVLAMDCLGTAAGKPLNHRTGYYADGTHDIYAIGNKAYIIDPPRLTATSDYVEPNHREPQNRSAPDPRHDGKLNVAFCDGHVDVMAVQDLGYVVNPDGSISVNAPGATNQLFSGTDRDDDPPPVQ